jgi:hypothetical protein
MPAGSGKSVAPRGIVSIYNSLLPINALNFGFFIHQDLAMKIKNPNRPRTQTNGDLTSQLAAEAAKKANTDAVARNSKANKEQKIKSALVYHKYIGC